MVKTSCPIFDKAGFSRDTTSLLTVAKTPSRAEKTGQHHGGVFADGQEYPDGHVRKEYQE